MDQMILCATIRWRSAAAPPSRGCRRRLFTADFSLSVRT